MQTASCLMKTIDVTFDTSPGTPIIRNTYAYFWTYPEPAIEGDFIIVPTRLKSDSSKIKLTLARIAKYDTNSEQAVLVAMPWTIDHTVLIDNNTKTYMPKDEK